MNKKCNCCNIDKDESEFFNNKRFSDGKSPRCKLCSKKDWIKYYSNQDNKLKHKSDSSKWAKDNVEKKRASGRRWDAKRGPIEKARRQKIKSECLEYKGNKCSKCGYDRCQAVLQFHHLDPSTKEFSIGEVVNSRNKITFEELKPELDKCIVLCSNCHIELHNQPKIKGKNEE